MGLGGTEEFSARLMHMPCVYCLAFFLPGFSLHVFLLVCLLYAKLLYPTALSMGAGT